MSHRESAWPQEHALLQAREAVRFGGSVPSLWVPTNTAGCGPRARAHALGGTAVTAAWAGGQPAEGATAGAGGRCDSRVDVAAGWGSTSHFLCAWRGKWVTTKFSLF